MNNLLEKFYRKSSLFHYITWVVITMSLFILIALPFTTVPAQKILVIAISISLFISIVPTYAIYLANKSQEFYDGLKPFETKANEVDDEVGLEALKDDLLDYCKEKSFSLPMTDEVRRILTIINTRLKHEFSDTKAEYIICSAVKFDFRGKKDVVVCGRRHGDCYDIIRALVWDIEEEEEPTRIQQGFVTNIGRYVERGEAYEIADKAGQLLLPANETPEMRILTSEDLY